MIKRLIIISALGVIFSGITICFSAEPPNAVHVIQLEDDTINPVTAEYIVNAIDNAVTQDVQCLIIKLDTPGGLLSSTRLIVKKIMSAQVPVVVYISPGGSRAGSAGVFITYASHVAAMAPSTNIGAAHPVQMGQKRGKNRDIWDGLKEILERTRKDQEISDEEGKQVDDPVPNAEDQYPEEHADDDPMSSKILQDTVAFIKSIAKKRNRNSEWAVKSVTKSSSITETEALELGVIEIIAKNEMDLLDQMDGRIVQMGEEEVVLHTKAATIKRVAMDSRQKFFNILANPNIAYILMILGFYGLLYEVTHPGIGVPGILGAIFLILAFYSMQTLPTNFAGVALVLLGLVLFIAEATVPGLGLLTLGGIVSMILGSLLLFDPKVPMIHVSVSLIFSFTLTTAGITIFLARSVFRAYRKKVLSGKEGMIGEKGKARTAISSDKEGKVFVHGELWNACSDDPIRQGDKIVILQVDGLMLKVKKEEF